MSKLQKPEITRQKTCVDTFDDLKEVYFWYGEKIKINEKHVIFKHTKTLMSKWCSMHPEEVESYVNEIGFVDGLCDIGDFIVVQDTNVVKKLCQI